MALAGLAYFILALASLILWSTGFNPYCGYGLFLGRPLLLWGATAYACMAVLCFAGAKRKVAIAGAAFLPAVHAAVLALAWRDSGYLCPACVTFLVIEAVLAAFLVFARGRKQYPVFLSLAGVFLLVGTGLLAYNPSVSGYVMPAGSAAEAVSGGAGSEAVVPDGAAAFGTPEKSPVGMAAVDAGQVEPGRPLVYNPPAGAAPALADSAAAAVPGKKYPVAKGPSVAVTTAGGKKVELDLSQRPALYFAWWCPACREVLREMARLAGEKRPYLVSVSYTAGDVNRSLQEVARAGLPGGEVYFSRGVPGNPGGIPVLLYAEGGEVK
ncbi:hypothetical protein MGLY_27910 [Neomoorella glycerini]|uniref:Thioredoxin-like fold n=1 Tax=Neomoorella glycerini TaxID=55779 RepID=A0A6I5ZTI7_9FIRM|nr:hypothetical protein [Moorella glycerini]QGP93383.1 hypothetical protein MGLY_27910 [Moorella glycerini]